MAHISVEQERELPEAGRLALQAFRRAVKEAFLTGQAYDPDGKGKAYWEAKDREEKASQGHKSA